VQTKIKDDNRDIVKRIVEGEIEVAAGDGITMPGFTITFTKGSAVNKDERFRRFLVDAGVDPEVINAAAVFSQGEIGEDRMMVKRGK